MGRGSSKAGRSKGGGTPEKSLKEMSVKEIEDKYGKYQYHATTRSAYSSIVNNGLIPSKGHAGMGVYMAPSAKEATDWTADTSTGGTTVLRVRTGKLAKKYGWGDLGEGESSAEKRISPADIEVRNLKGEWVNVRKAGSWIR